MLRYLVVFLLIVGIPTLTIAVRSPSKAQLDKEMFKHVEFPCAANMAIKVMKELGRFKSISGGSRKYSDTSSSKEYAENQSNYRRSWHSRWSGRNVS